MKLLFINSAYPKESYNQFKGDSRGVLQVPSDVFQWAVIDGLERCGVDYTLVCTPALPAWPHYKHLYTPGGIMKVDGKARGHFLSYCDAPIIKQFDEKRVIRKYVRDWCLQNKEEDRLSILVYTPQEVYLGAAIELKREFPNLIVAPIVTDLIDNALDFSSNRTFLKRMQVALERYNEHRLFPKIDKYILLTRQMVERIPEADGRYIVVEGIAPQKDSNTDAIQKVETPRTLLYTGVLEEYAGIRLLVNAFRAIHYPNIRLIICGSGNDAQYVRKAVSEDSRIIYQGQVNREEAVRLQRECTLLINPRQPNGDITKYSFPSKTMEYMTSGTPMIGYHLEGIPEEYHKYMFTPDDLSIEALSNCISYSLSLPNDVLKRKAEMASCFIYENKNSEVQVGRIIDFLTH